MRWGWSARTPTNSHLKNERSRCRVGCVFRWVVCTHPGEAIYLLSLRDPHWTALTLLLLAAVTSVVKLATVTVTRWHSTLATGLKEVVRKRTSEQVTDGASERARESVDWQLISATQFVLYVSIRRRHYLYWHGCERGRCFLTTTTRSCYLEQCPSMLFVSKPVSEPINLCVLIENLVRILDKASQTIELL